MTPPLPGEQGWTGIDVDGSGIDMYPAPAGKMMSDIAAVLTDAQSMWKEKSGRIEELAGRLGDGPMGKPFKKKYDPPAKKISENTTENLKTLADLSKSGTEAVPLYVNQDQAAGTQFEF